MGFKKLLIKFLLFPPVKFFYKNIEPIIITLIIHIFLLLILIYINFKIVVNKSVYIYPIAVEKVEDNLEEKLKEAEKELQEQLLEQKKYDSEIDLNDFSTVSTLNDGTSGSQNDEAVFSEEDLSKLRERFSSLEIIKEITTIEDENGNQIEVDLFDDRVKTGRKVKVPKYQPKKENSKKEEEKGKNKVYKGKSIISYKLEGRYDVELPNPAFTCPEGGYVVINIKVNRGGKVTDVKVDKLNSSTINQCLIDAALEYAKRAIFNVDQNATEIQEGFISYSFF